MTAINFAFDYIYNEKQPTEDYKSYDFSTIKPSSDKISSLYRGLYFSTKEHYDSFMDSIREGTLITNQLTSWTTSEVVALQFSLMRYFSAEKQGYFGVILKTTGITSNRVLFDGESAHYQFFEEEREIPAKKPYIDEKEYVLLPSNYDVEVFYEFSYEEAARKAERKSVS
ncbi:hypothetical protein J2S74_002951 [Evansella vedderi]|uniref:Uncharacterized protein n=1 Tax=Evansella vedderi TaxID=38282 RepID=A0ABT9ZWH5_9BACI|nr:hypothetical protein [Evansella vedderi]MDQ0255569.1 hypothetical protein [Evansella vedderi]